MRGCECEAETVETQEQRRILSTALILNAAMFVVEVAVGIQAQSSGLLADGLDMLADAAAYGIALLAISRSAFFKARSASISGGTLILLGTVVIADAVRRGLFGSEPESTLIVIIGFLALGVNAFVLRLLARIRDGGVHLTATWIFTRADVIANCAVIVSGVVVWSSGYRYIDLIVGGGIGIYVIKEALEILSEAREAHRDALH